MRTAIISDLHLGSAHGEDVLRDAAIRRLLVNEIQEADRVVLLGDVLELREVPLPVALETARPLFEELGRALGKKPVVLIPGNHDHRLAEPLLEQLAISERTSLGLEHNGPPLGGATQQMASWLGEADLTISYPGIWLREDVYATHGHYMDCHMSLPRIECIAAAALMRSGDRPPDPATTADYERILRPVYGLAFGIAQSGLRASAARPSERIWRSLNGEKESSNSGAIRRKLRTAVGRAGVEVGAPAAVWTLNRLLHADFSAVLSPAAITQSGIDAASEMARRLRIEAAHVITGHTHRGGPEEADAEWLLPGGGRLHNTGNWVFSSAFHRPGTPPSPYWPGTVTWVEEEGAPRRTRLLMEHGYAEMRTIASEARPS